MIEDVKASASALYDGGWRSADREQLMAEHKLTTDEADLLCNELEKIDYDTA
jgi:hypothetical protein